MAVFTVSLQTRLIHPTNNMNSGSNFKPHRMPLTQSARLSRGRRQFMNQPPSLPAYQMNQAPSLTAYPMNQPPSLPAYQMNQAPSLTAYPEDTVNTSTNRSVFESVRNAAICMELSRPCEMAVTFGHDILKAFCGNIHNRAHSSSCYIYCSSYSNSITLITSRDMLHTAYLLAFRSNSITIPYLYTHFQTAMFRRVLPRAKFPRRKMPVGNGMYSPLCFLLQMQG
jgi:hypothetical protein